jgi:hypothetical protein
VRGRVGRQNLKRRKAGRYSGRAAYEIRAHYQSQDRINLKTAEVLLAIADEVIE